MIKRNIILPIMLCLLIFICGLNVYAQKYNLKIAADQSATGSNTYGWWVFEKYVEDKSEGQIQVDVYYAGQLGVGEDVLEKIRTNILDISLGDESVASAYPPLMVLQIPYMWDNVEMLSEFVDKHPFWQELNDGLEKETGLRILTVNPYGMYCFINNKKPVKTLEDLKGLKFRVKTGCPHILKALEGMGAAGTPVDWGEVYTSIKTGVIDGIPQAVNTHYDQKFYEVAKYLTLDNSFIGYNLTLVNAKWWHNLPGDIKTIIQQGARLGSLTETALSLVRDSVIDLKEIEKAGVEIYVLPNNERERFKEAAQKATIEWMNQEIGEEYVQKMLNAVKEIEESKRFKD